ncbi:MAG: aconitate hydratase AcnA [Methanomassiliicoccales archaeon]
MSDTTPPVFHNEWASLHFFTDDSGREIYYYSLEALEQAGLGKISQLPLSIRIVLESLLRNLDGREVRKEDVISLASWNPTSPADVEVPFKVARVLMQDFTGVPAIVDLAAMRDAIKRLNKDPELIQPQVPVDLVIDHSVQVDAYGNSEAFQLNKKLEMRRNSERYSFLKWASSSFRDLRVIPPSLGIVHQVNLEYLATVVSVRQIGKYLLSYPDSLVGTDSHTTMVNGIGVFGFGVGGIEAEAAVLNQPVTFSQPQVVGVHVTGEMREGVNATDLVLTLTNMLRKENVVGKFVEFYGPGIRNLSVPDRATLTNMCPEYGATVALFPVDDETLDYLRFTGRTEEHIHIVKKYYQSQGLFDIDYSKVKYSSVVELDLSKIRSSVAGPKLPQSRMDLTEIRNNFEREFILNNSNSSRTEEMEASSGSHLLSSAQRLRTVEVQYPDGAKGTVSDGDIVIAAITSCTNTSNPEVMFAAGLLARNAVSRGLKVDRRVKTSFAPGSRVVTDYLKTAGLMEYLEKLGFYLVGYGCTTCIGNSGPLPEPVATAVVKNRLTVASVLSGNRNFEARIHNDVKANYLMSPPLVIAFAIAGTVLKDLTTESLDKSGVMLKDIWPGNKEIKEYMSKYITPDMFRKRYADILTANEEWNNLPVPQGLLYSWDPKSTYIQSPPFFEEGQESILSSIMNARVLAVFGDALTTDHISPAGAIAADSPAWKYLQSMGVSPIDMNTYGSRRGNDRVMVRGTFANRRIKNLLLPGVEGGYTLHFPDGEKMTIYDAAMKYRNEGVPLIVFAGSEYGTGSSRDWAAKGPKLLGVRAVVARSFERIHRSNLIGMGILPLEFTDGQDFNTLSIDPSRTVSIEIPKDLKPRQRVSMHYTTKDAKAGTASLLVRIDNEVELSYCSAGGILHYVLNRLTAASQ